jgi:hypothetical protein
MPRIERRIADTTPTDDERENARRMLADANSQLAVIVGCAQGTFDVVGDPLFSDKVATRAIARCRAVMDAYDARTDEES